MVLFAEGARRTSLTRRYRETLDTSPLASGTGGGRVFVVLGVGWAEVAIRADNLTICSEWAVEALRALEAVRRGVVHTSCWVVSTAVTGVLVRIYRSGWANVAMWTQDFFATRRRTLSCPLRTCITLRTGRTITMLYPTSHPNRRTRWTRELLHI
jgi:hypothetical protein